MSVLGSEHTRPQEHGTWEEFQGEEGNKGRRMIWMGRVVPQEAKAPSDLAVWGPLEGPLEAQGYSPFLGQSDKHTLWVTRVKKERNEQLSTAIHSPWLLASQTPYHLCPFYILGGGVSFTVTESFYFVLTCTISCQDIWELSDVMLLIFLRMEGPKL